MARSVVAGHPITLDEGYTVLYGPPCLSTLALPVYSKVLPKRLETFPQPLKNQARCLIMIPEEINPKSLQSLPWTHELWHDGESVFWLLVWWAIHLRPSFPLSSTPPPSKINGITFGYLTNMDLAKGMDGRSGFMNELANGISWLDPEYQELEPLFLQMASQLTGDLYWAKYGGTVEMQDPEFLHEALQRIIFNFLMENQTEPFMTLKKDPHHHREVEPQIPRHAEKQVTKSKRTLSTDSEAEGGEGPNAKRTKYSN